MPYSLGIFLPPSMNALAHPNTLLLLPISEQHALRSGGPVAFHITHPGAPNFSARLATDARQLSRWMICAPAAAQRAASAMVFDPPTQDDPARLGWIGRAAELDVTPLDEVATTADFELAPEALHLTLTTRLESLRLVRESPEQVAQHDEPSAAGPASSRTR